ncbi:MAG: dTDP-glucose 4,6-dehydratase [Candidatus Levybacteria bacterium RIFCSPHIGHO2_12_FULL_38_12]|nr:MAG: dTDP-glucose 4,6-dehydratase [Candidatus Levybacteria bacterium RIFCSPHIGHO2_01_FULL_38_12]OGH21706.1 MAG: dTDP-glucose 4,6-dehydratase [Candidatus Levybacteria bacterium RIFCSPHIGHO2_02_FULL_37_18]OGH22636.1 MAG: dTDP-glucose 4,6-dehydratase [Candidatus Levybacteria bacterium RIFCSPHIGHO2_12_FULL_38_12]OGH33327.1 MAG: dTDP-glucose 4,6-dehydratase [Candidatus Levybacteria bacterium RIFCSPLOWO2_01_FULL_37_20]OGH43716.1 MAG: dTDP-glucose 4,6-dehydratase [Candidatus Levybacteria bacterium 
MSKLLVTGGAGFIGANFIRYWLSKYSQDSIVNLDKLTYAGHPENLLSLEKSSRYSFIKGDITNKADVDSAIKNVDIVVHFAAESHVDRSIEDPMTFIKTNVLGTGVLLDACLRQGRKRFHHVSTDEVYGELGPRDLPFNEKSPLNPRSPYAASKAGSDLIVKTYYTAYGLPVTITNCANNYGQYQDSEKLIPRFITKLLSNNKVPLMSEGENIRSWLAVVDHCRAIDIVLKKGKIGETYCVGGEEKTNLEITKSILKILEKDDLWIDFVWNRAVNDFRYALDDSKIRKLGWKPKHDFEHWLKDTVEWYKNNKWWWKKSSLKQSFIDFKRTFLHNN